MLPLMACDHIRNSANSIEIELASTKGRNVAVNIIPKRLIASPKTLIKFSL
jgi:hypothetical protein